VKNREITRSIARDTKQPGQRIVSQHIALRPTNRCRSKGRTAACLPCYCYNTYSKKTRTRAPTKIFCRRRAHRTKCTPWLEQSHPSIQCTMRCFSSSKWEKSFVTEVTADDILFDICPNENYNSMLVNPIFLTYRLSVCLSFDTWWNHRQLDAHRREDSCKRRSQSRYPQVQSVWQLPSSTVGQP
jgi:hypothetical protein